MIPKVELRDGKIKKNTHNMKFDLGEIILYQSEDGQSSIDVHFKDETVWLTQVHMSELFQRDQSVVSRHINNVFREGELPPGSNMQKMHIANSDKPVAFHNFNVIISVGYRVKSQPGTRVSHAAVTRLRESAVFLSGSVKRECGYMRQASPSGPGPTVFYIRQNLPWRIRSG